MTIAPEHIITLKNKQFVLWIGLLDAATKAGLKSIEVKLLQFPAAENGNLAISEATVTFEDGRLFTEIGDCGPHNCTAMIAPHACRMSATRAKGRALRDALNVGVTMFEELGPEPAETGPQTSPAARTGDPAPRRARHDPADHAARQQASDAAQDAELGAAACAAAGCGVLLTLDEIRGSRTHFGDGVRYCTVHGKQRKQEEAVVSG